MAKLTDAKIKSLEEHKDHLLKEIEEHVNRIMKDRDQLVKTISETQKKIEDMAANGTMEGVAESDIYNAENIVKGFFLIIYSHIFERVFFFFEFFQELSKLLGYIVKNFVCKCFISTSVVIFINHTFHSLGKFQAHNTVDLLKFLNSLS